MNATMDQDKFKGGIREAVREALAEKEEANRLAAVEDLLRDAEVTINDLNQTINDKNEEVASISEEKESLLAKVDELQEKLTEYVSKLEESDKTLKELEDRAEAAEKEVATIAAEQRLAVRMEQLKEAKVSFTDEASFEGQKNRVRDLSDEEFASYLEERVSLRKQLENEIKEAAATAGSTGNEEVPPADITKSRKEEAAQAAAATLDVEVASESISEKYKEMANAMAKRMREGRE